MMHKPIDHQATLTALQKGSLDLEGQFLNGSNGTFLGVLTWQDEQLRVVYKPVKGENPLWDFPAHTLARREVAAYVVSQALGWELVPPTVYRRRKAPFGAGSYQLYIEHDPDYHYFNFSDADRSRLRPVALFDLLINNADRKGSHVLVDAQGHLWLIDHGICFHPEEKLRTVIWDFAGESLPGDLAQDLQHLAGLLRDESHPLRGELLSLLSAGEVSALGWRARRLVEMGIFPYPSSAHRSYPYPPV